MRREGSDRVLHFGQIPAEVESMRDWRVSRRACSHGRAYLVALLFWLIWSRDAIAQIQPASVELVDSLGTAVGPVLDLDPSGFAEVPLMIDGHPTYLAFRRSTPDSIRTTSFIEGVFFAAADCTGQGYAYYLGGSSTFLEPHGIGGLNNTFYAGSAAATPAPFAYNSVLRGGQACSAESDTLPTAAPVNPVRDLTPPWQPPFQLQFGVAPAPSPVPAVSAKGLLILALLLGGTGIVLLRKRVAATKFRSPLRQVQSPESPA